MLDVIVSVATFNRLDFGGDAHHDPDSGFLKNDYLLTIDNSRRRFVLFEWFLFASVLLLL